MGRNQSAERGAEKTSDGVCVKLRRPLLNFKQGSAGISDGPSSGVVAQF